MAQALASHRAAPASRRPSKPAPRTIRPKLKVLNQKAIRQRARRRNALLVLFVVVLVGFFGVALVQAQLVADQQGLDVMRARIAEAEAENARMRREVEEASAPDIIVDWATNELGMVRAYQPVFLTAVAPIRDVPVAPAFQPQRTEAFDLAAPQAAAASSITVGIDGRASLDVDEPAEVALTPPAANPSATDPVASEAAPIQTQSTEPSSTPQASVAGRSAIAGQSAPASEQPAKVRPGTATTTGGRSGTIAGMTAVAGGSGSG